MKVRVNANHKVYFGSRIYSEGDVVDAPSIVAAEWVNAGRVRKLQDIRSKPVKAPEPVLPEPSAQVKAKSSRGVDGPEFGTAPGRPLNP